MDDQDENNGQFTLGDWFESKPEYFQASEEVREELQKHMSALSDFCMEHSLPLVAMAVTKDDKEQYMFEGRSVMPLARCNATILAAEAVIALGIQSEETAEFLDAIIECDIDRQQRENFPPLKLVH